MPTTVNVYENEGSPPVLTLERDVTLFRANVKVKDARGIESVACKPSPSAAASTSSIPPATRSPRSKVTGRAGIFSCSLPAVASSAWSPRNGPESAKSSSPPPTTTSSLSPTRLESRPSPTRRRPRHRYRLQGKELTDPDGTPARCAILRSAAEPS